MDTIEQDLIAGKVTPGTIRYEAEPTNNGQPPKIKSLYIPKWVLGATPPTKIHLVITEVM